MDFIRKYRATISHFGFWAGYYLILTLLVFNNEEDAYHPLRVGLATISHASITYINLWWLMPKFYFRRRYFIYTLLVVAIGWIWVEGHHRVDSFIPKHPDFDYTRQQFEKAVHGTYLLLIIALSAGHRLLQISREQEEEVELLKQRKLKRAQEASILKSENLETELKFLKSQINPHFLFNALNNIYTLAYIKATEAPDMILKLSDMLRYILYDCTTEEVPIAKEINYLKNYIELQQLKADDIDIQVTIDEFAPQVKIAPMLLIPFIENSFKHSKIEDTQEGWIRIALLHQDQQICFKVSNSKPPQNFTKDKVGGIGLQNVKRRLELLYPHRYNLEIVEEADSFKATLLLSENLTVTPSIEALPKN
ncbi:hypothetical protein BKI52_44390 [marine bacterium AO1-C]|nr:hypothetical protein BKI52_44390 [marine bacterium AO1-C]